MDQKTPEGSFGFKLDFFKEKTWKNASLRLQALCFLKIHFLTFADFREFETELSLPRSFLTIAVKLEKHCFSVFFTYFLTVLNKTCKIKTIKSCKRLCVQPENFSLTKSKTLSKGLRFEKKWIFFQKQKCCQCDIALKIILEFIWITIILFESPLESSYRDFQKKENHQCCQSNIALQNNNIIVQKNTGLERNALQINCSESFRNGSVGKHVRRFEVPFLDVLTEAGGSVASSRFLLERRAWFLTCVRALVKAVVAVLGPFATLTGGEFGHSRHPGSPNRQFVG